MLISNDAHTGMEFIKPNEEEITLLNRLDSSYTEISEMSNEEREYLTALILGIRPKKLLEVGVSAGGGQLHYLMP
jgi:predicted O-methyltransferase YrrM